MVKACALGFVVLLMENLQALGCYAFALPICSVDACSKDSIEQLMG